MSKEVDRVARQTLVAFIGIEIITGVITASALLDRLLGLGWGYAWRDAAIGAGIMIGGGVLYLICGGIFRFVGDR